MSTSQKWFYAQAGQQTGPISIDQIQDLIARNQIKPADLVWREGLATWLPAGEVAELRSTVNTISPTIRAAAPSPVESSDAEAPLAVSYYTANQGMPPRAAAVLAGHAIPLGDTANWPLDDTQIIEFEKTLKLRKRISSAATLYKSLGALTAISFVIMLIAFLASGFAPRNRRSAVFLPDNLTGIGVTVAFGLLYFFAYQATRKSKRWAPITMLVVFIICGLIQVASTAFISSFAPRGPAIGFAAIPAIVVLLFVAAFAYVSGRAMVAIPQYLNQPAWCQELVVKAGL